MHPVFYIGGYRLKRVTAYYENNELVWSKETGRSSTGKMVGDIICEKYTAKVEMTMLPDGELEKLKEALQGVGEPFKVFSFERSDGKRAHDFDSYRSTLTCEMQGWDSEDIYWKVSVEFIEQ